MTEGANRPSSVSFEAQEIKLIRCGAGLREEDTPLLQDHSLIMREMPNQAQQWADTSSSVSLNQARSQKALGSLGSADGDAGPQTSQLAPVIGSSAQDVE